MVHANLRPRAAVRLAGLRPLVPTRPSGPDDHTKSPRRKPGDSGSRTSSVAMRCGFEPGKRVPSCGMDGGMVFGPGVPGFPPGASWSRNGRFDRRRPPLQGRRFAAATVAWTATVCPAGRTLAATTPGQACTGHGWPCRREGKPAPRLRPRRAKPAGGCVSRRRIPSGLLRLTARLAWRASHRPAGRTLAATTPGQACRGHGWPGRREIQSPRSSRKFSRSATRLE